MIRGAVILLYANLRNRCLSTKPIDNLSILVGDRTMTAIPDPTCELCPLKLKHRSLGSRCHHHDPCNIETTLERSHQNSIACESRSCQFDMVNFEIRGILLIFNHV